jgi:hypothetical protein
MLFGKDNGKKQMKKHLAVNYCRFVTTQRGPDRDHEGMG